MHKLFVIRVDIFTIGFGFVVENVFPPQMLVNLFLGHFPTLKILGSKFQLQFWLCFLLKFTASPF